MYYSTCIFTLFRNWNKKVDIFGPKKKMLTDCCNPSVNINQRCCIFSDQHCVSVGTGCFLADPSCDRLAFLHIYLFTDFFFIYLTEKGPLSFDVTILRKRRQRSVIVNAFLFFNFLFSSFFCVCVAVLNN